MHKSKTIWAVVGALAFVEFVSGILQGYYIPLMSDIASHFQVHDADVNWLEGAQLMLSAMAVPLFAKLGDRRGYGKMLLLSAAITAVASVALVFATNWYIFLFAWALQGVYVVWLPLEIALVWARSQSFADSKAKTAKAAGILVACLELGAVSGALVSGALANSLPAATPSSLKLVLAVPAIAVIVCAFIIGFFVRDSLSLNHRPKTPFDFYGLILISLTLVFITGGLALMRISEMRLLAFFALALGGALLLPFTKSQLAHPDALLDVRMFKNPALWPLFLTAGLFGMSVLGAQAPLSTFARTDPDIYGYGLGAGAFATSLLIGAYVLSMAAGAFIYPLLRRVFGPKNALGSAALLVSLGYLLFLLLHDTYGQVITNMVIAGIGSGMLVAALPAAAASAALSTQTGVATGLTNSVKTLGGAIASCIFGIALLQGASGSAGSFAGYMTVWTVCGLSALIAAVCLFIVVPKKAL